MSYYGSVVARAFKETKTVWNLHRFWGTLAVPLSGAFLRLIVKGNSPVTEVWHEVFFFAIFGFVACWGGSYLIYLVRVPAILHREQSDVIASLTAAPLLSPQERCRVEIVKQELETFSEKEKVVLRYIWGHGSVNNHTLPNRGLDGNAASEALRKGVQRGLLIMTSDATSRDFREQLLAMREWRINPDLESSFTHIFTQGT